MQTTYPKGHLKGSEHVRVSVCHPDLMTIPHYEEHVDKLVFPQIFNNILNVLSVSSLRVIET